MMRVSKRKLFNRGHIVPLPGSPLGMCESVYVYVCVCTSESRAHCSLLIFPFFLPARRPAGSQPVVLRNDEMANTGRNSGTFRPQTAAERLQAEHGALKRTMSREASGNLYTRQTQEKILNSSGQAISMHCARSGWRFQRPLDRIFCTRPTGIGSSLAYAPVPDCAECILAEGPYSTLAGAAKLKINEKTSEADKLFLISQRPKTVAMSQVRQPAPNQAPPFFVDYRRSSPRQVRPVWRKQLVY